MSLRKIGPRECWTVEITVDDSATARTGHGEGAIAVDIGWRQIGEELRIACWGADNGKNGGELRLSAALLSSLRKADELRSLRDDKFNVARAALSGWLATATVPEWLHDATTHLAQWRSAGRLAGLAKRWRDGRFDGDADAYDALEAWRYHDHHLWEWESSQRTKSLRHRREIYRVFAAGLASQFETCVLEKFDLRVFAQRVTTENAAENEAARSNRQRAALSELRMAITNAFRARGGRVDEVSAVDSTHICAECGTVDDFDAAEAIEHVCSGCGATWDQDMNSWRVLLARWQRERVSAAEKAVSARENESGKEIEEVAESRWVRARRMAAKKKERKEGAREAVGTPAE